jgi:hypothetical protein
MFAGNSARSIKGTIATLAFGTLLFCVCPVQASTIDIQFVGFPIHYGTLPASAIDDFYDAASSAGRTTTLATATKMGSVVVSVDGVVQYTYSADQVYGDLFVADVGSLNKNGSTVFAGDSHGTGLDNQFGFDLLTATGSLLSLNFNQSDIAGMYRAYSSGANSGKPFYLSFGGAINSIVAQNLPGTLQIGNDASISFSGTTFSNVQASGGVVTSFDATLTGSITGTQVPEPGTLALLSMGVLGLACYVPLRNRTRKA